MKKLFVLAACFAVMLAGVLATYAIPDQTLPSGGAFYEGTVESTARTAAIAVETAARVAATTAQADTNVNTVASSYTPRRVGDVLVGGAGTGTNAVWIATGATTNGWTRVAP